MSVLVKKRKGSDCWYVVATRQSTKTTNKTLAEAFAREVTQKSWRKKMMGETTQTFADLSAAWLDVKSEKKSIAEDKFLVSDFTEFLTKRRMVDKPITEITKETIRQYGAQAKERSSAKRANNLLDILRGMLIMAERDIPGFRRPHIDKYQVAKKEPRWLSPEELVALLAALPDFQKDMVAFAVQTGLRYSNWAGLQWDWVSDDMTLVTVPATFTKTRRTYSVPVSATAKEILTRWKEKRVNSLVFWNPDAPGEYVKQLRFKWAAKRAGIKHVTPHQLRHTFASWHRLAGTPDYVIQAICGWSTPAMLQNYAHVNPAHLAAYADNLEKVSPLTGKVTKA